MRSLNAQRLSFPKVHYVPLKNGKGYNTPSPMPIQGYYTMGKRSCASPERLIFWRKIQFFSVFFRFFRPAPLKQAGRPPALRPATCPNGNDVCDYWIVSGENDEAKRKPDAARHHAGFRGVPEITGCRCLSRRCCSRPPSCAAWRDENHCTCRAGRARLHHRHRTTRFRCHDRRP